MTRMDGSRVTRSRADRMSRRELIGRLGAVGLAAVSPDGLVHAARAAPVGATRPLRAEPASRVPVRGGILRLGNRNPGTLIDPPTFTSGTIGNVLNLVTEHLVRSAPDGSAEPQLAVDWGPSRDGLTWTFALRPGVEFTDGSPFTSADVVATFDRLIAPDSTSAAKGMFAGLLGSVEAIDDLTVAFVLERPFGDFPYLVSSISANTVILPAHYSGGWQDHPVGTGPLRITDLQVDRGVTFERFERSWRADEVHIDGASYTFFADANAMHVAFLAGDLDIVPITDPVMMDSLDPDRFTYVTTPSNSFNALALRVDTAPFDRVEMREAVAWALDRSALNDVLAAGRGTIGNDHVFGPTQAVQPAGVPQRERDLDRVAELLAGEELSFEITTVGGYEERFATVVQQQLAEAGIDVSLNVLPNERYYAPGDASPWLNAPATATYWVSRPSPSQLVSLMLTSSASWNASHYSNPEVDGLLVDYDAATDPSSKQAAASRMATILNDEVPLIVALYDSANRAHSRRVHGVVAHPSHLLDVAGLWIEG